jgi:ankyrin repeat protein
MKFVLRHPHTSNLLGKCHSSPWVQAGFFFHDRGMELQKSINGLLSEMIYQILRKQRRLLPLVLPLFDERVQPRRTLTSSASKSPWYTEDLREALLLIVSQAEEKLNICFFIDALDEHFGNHHELLQTLKDFVTTAGRNSHHVKLCIASRPENVFKAELAKVPGLAIHEHTEGDFQEYVFRRMQPEIDRRDHEQLNDLAKDVVDKAQGVFLWVKLVVDELVEGACDGESVSKLRDFLSDIPSELEDLYRRAIRRVRDRRFSKKLKDKHCGEAFVMFQVALCCRSPYPLVAFINTTSLLVSGIIQENLPLDSQRRPIPTDDMRRQLSARCGGLLETVTGAQHNRTAQKDVVQFIHQTAKEFTQKGEIRAALSEGLSNFPDENGHVLLLRYCVKVVRQDLDLRIPDFLFHARNAEKATRQSQANEINMLIDSGGSQALSNVGRLLTEMDIPKSFNAIREGVRDPKMILLLIAAYGGLKYYLRYEISEVKRSTEDDGRLLAAVIEEMHSRLSIRENPPDSGLITPLLEAGIKPDSPFGGQTALIRAVHPPEDFAYTTDPEVVERLLEAGADVNAQGGRFGNALQAASYQCYEKIVGQLLKAGANINAQGGKFGNALQAASVRGHEKVVEQLLKAGADVNAQGGKFNNALQAASYHGQEKVVERLLEAGANVHAQDGRFGNALQAASVTGHEKVVEQLLKAGADVNTQGGKFNNALQAALQHGHRMVVQRLLEAGAEANA